MLEQSKSDCPDSPAVAYYQDRLDALLRERAAGRTLLSRLSEAQRLLDEKTAHVAKLCKVVDDLTHRLEEAKSKHDKAEDERASLLASRDDLQLQLGKDSLVGTVTTQADLDKGLLALEDLKKVIASGTGSQAAALQHIAEVENKLGAVSKALSSPSAPSSGVTPPLQLVLGPNAPVSPPALPFGEDGQGDRRTKRPAPASQVGGTTGDVSIDGNADAEAGAGVK